MAIDLGTGDGRLPWTLAREAPDRLFVGIDAHAAGLRELSGRAFRLRLRNLLYVRAAVEDLPRELAGAADRVSVVLPWGSLLRAVALPDPGVLGGIRRLCREDARFTVVLAVDAERDRAEHARLGLPPMGDGHLTEALPRAYEEAGFRVRSVRRLDAEALRVWPTTWARTLAHGRPRSVFQIEARGVRTGP